jgi:LacI family transcriptional regulator
VLAAIEDRLERARQTVVLVDCQHPDYDCITVDNVSGGFRATQHLIDLGCTRIALVMASDEAPPAVDRRTGYRQALQENNIEYDEQLVASVGGVEDGFSEAGGYEAMKRILATGRHPDGVFATSDVQALGVLRAVEEFGLSVPDDIRLVGFDDIPLLQYAGITTMSQPMYELGSLAAQRLLARLDDPDLPRAHVVQAPDLVVRSTSSADDATATEEVEVDEFEL